VRYAFDISERFDTPVLVRLTTRIAHSKSVVKVTGSRSVPVGQSDFQSDVPKYVMLPVYARLRRPLIEERLTKLVSYTETFPFNRIMRGESHLGMVTSGVAYQYARDVFPRASFLKLGMTYPLPQNLIRRFAAQVDRMIVIEELDPFLQENIQAMGVKVTGKEFIPRLGELTPEVIEEECRSAGLLAGSSPRQVKPVPVLHPGRLSPTPCHGHLCLYGCQYRSGTGYGEGGCQ